MDLDTERNNLEMNRGANPGVIAQYEKRKQDVSSEVCFHTYIANIPGRLRPSLQQSKVEKRQLKRWSGLSKMLGYIQTIIMSGSPLTVRCRTIGSLLWRSLWLASARNSPQPLTVRRQMNLYPHPRLTYVLPPGIRCAGEIRISRHEDFDKWAIDILVKFRDDERLQLLTAQRQSGGVRCRFRLITPSSSSLSCRNVH